jgi:Ca2+-transporting ATPase
MAFFTLVLGELLRAFSTRSERTSLFKLGLTTNKPMVLSVLGSLALMILLVLIPAAREAFGIALPSGNLWLVVGLMGLLPLVGGELHKLTLRKNGTTAA